MRTRKIGICDFCNNEKNIIAKGLCNACYQRKQKTGSLEYKRTGRNTCSIADCDDFVVSHGLCDKHRSRLRKHGSTDQTRPSDWGSREKHPLYSAWATRRRSENKDLCKEWDNDFWLFVSDVGDKPSAKHVVSLIDDSKPYSKDNFKWAEREAWPKDVEEKRLLGIKKVKEWRRSFPEKEKNLYLKNRYGITYKHYEYMANQQGDICAICNNEETMISHHSGKVQRLAVDHCHSTGKIRGLLCSKCNTALGGFKDNIDLLKQAIIYLENANKD